MVILSWSRVLVISLLILSSNSHLFLTMTEIFKMSIILTWIRSYFSRNLISCFFSDQSSLTSRISMTDMPFVVILSRGRILIISLLILSSYCHLFLSMTEIFKMSVILSWIRPNFSWNLVACLFFYQSSCTFRFSMTMLRFVLSWCRV